MPLADPEDSAIDHPGFIDYAEFLDRGALEGARIGIWRTASTSADARTEALLDEAVGCLRALGAAVVDPVDLPDIEKVTEPEFDALEYEFKHGINAYLKHLSAYAGGSDLELPGSLAELIEFNERNAPRVLAKFGQEIFLAAQATNGDLADPVYLELRGAASILARTAVETPVAGAPPGRDLLADREPGLADRLRARRPLGVRHVQAGSGFRLADDHRAVRLRLRAARRGLAPRPPVERAAPARAGLRLRAGDEFPSRSGPSPVNWQRAISVSACICICKCVCPPGEYQEIVLHRLWSM